MTSSLYFVCVCPSWLIHTARNPDRGRIREMMSLCVTLCTVHTTQGQGTIAFCCARPGPCPCPGTGPVQCVWAMTLYLSFFSSLTYKHKHLFTSHLVLITCLYWGKWKKYLRRRNYRLFETIPLIYWISKCHDILDKYHGNSWYILYFDVEFSQEKMSRNDIWFVLTDLCLAPQQ